MSVNNWMLLCLVVYIDQNFLQLIISGCVYKAIADGLKADILFCGWLYVLPGLLACCLVWRCYMAVLKVFSVGYLLYLLLRIYGNYYVFR